MKTKPITIILLTLGLFFLMATSILAEDIDDPALILGRTEKTDTFFEIADSRYLNISLQSSEEITVLLESAPKTISLYIETSESIGSTVLTIGNLGPNKTYYKYEDSYKNEVEFITDENGKYAWTQDLSQLHHVWIQHINGTVFLPGECSTYGIWDELTSTCTLTQDLTESVEITTNGITLNCDDYSITGTDSGYGIYLNRRKGTTIKNCAISNFDYGTYLVFSSNYNVITSNTVNNNYIGIQLIHSMYNTITFNTANDNHFGIRISSSQNNTLTNNNLTNNDWYSLWDDGAYGCNYIDDLSNIGGDGKPILYKHDTTGLMVQNTDAYSEIIFCNVGNSLIDNVTISNPGTTSNGIIFLRSDNNTIENSNLSNNYYGIFLHQSSGNTTTNNATNSNDENGIRLYASSNNTLTNNAANNNEKYGISLSFSNNNKIYHNNFIDNKTQAWDYAGTGNLFDNGYPDGGNYWSDYDTAGEGCVDVNNDGFCDNPYIFKGGEDRYPFMKESGWEGPPVNQPPAFSNVGQFKSDEITTISEGGTTTESTIVFKATVSDPDNDKVKLQVQIKEVDREWQDIIESNLVNSGSEALVTKYGLIEGQYRWRARAMDERGAVSDWQEFGTSGNVDFEVKLVPLYTQVESPYPSDEETKKWSVLPYASATEESPYLSCGWTIGNCGCAIASVVMILRFYDITPATDNKDVNPSNFNDWLNNNSGYNSGDLDWDKIDNYSRDPQSNIKRLHYVGPINSKDNDILDMYLASLQPTILKVYPIVQGKPSPHFIVADGKLLNTYTIKDPAWYNTKKLTQVPDSYVYNYNNNFSQLRLLSPTIAVRGIIHIHLASPAELLVIDPLSRRLGKDPIANIEYNEIPGGVYYLEGIGNPFAETPILVEEAKNIWIPDPIDGNYDVKIIGTGTGGYIADFSIYDQTGQSEDITQEGNTTTDNIQEFDLNYFAETIEEVELYRIVDIDIKPGSDPNSINLKSKGVTPVAVLTDEFFNAENIVIDSVLFAEASPKKGKLEDADNDSDLDLMLHFKTQNLQLTPDDIEATLTGQLTDGTLIKGTDSITIVPSEKEERGKKNSLLIGIIPLCIVGVGFLIYKKKPKFPKGYYRRNKTKKN